MPQPIKLWAGLKKLALSVRSNSMGINRAYFIGDESMLTVGRLVIFTSTAPPLKEIQQCKLKRNDQRKKAQWRVFFPTPNDAQPLVVFIIRKFNHIPGNTCYNLLEMLQTMRSDVNQMDSISFMAQFINQVRIYKLDYKVI